jgi:glycosyltransferase involved in cell wall biosynthesis
MNNVNPIISVVMPVYNGERFLNEAIDSILNQSYKNFEFLIIDDCSTDKSSDIINSYLDERITFVKNKNNIGQSATMNKGIQFSRGKYIARLDQDDIAYENRLKIQIEFIEKTNCSIVGSWSQTIDESGQVNGYFQHPIEFNIILNATCISVPFLHSSVLMKKKDILLVGGYSENFIIAMDWDLWIKILKKGLIIKNIPKVLISFRNHSNQTSINKKMLLITYKENLRLIRTSRKLINDKSYYNASVAWEYHNNLMLNIEIFKKDKNITRLFSEVIKIRPLFQYIKLIFFYKIINKVKYFYTPPLTFIKK